jgi:hypothetical protein
MGFQKVVKGETQRVRHQKDNLVVLESFGFKEEVFVLWWHRGNIAGTWDALFSILITGQERTGASGSLTCQTTLERSTLLIFDWYSRKLLEVDVSMGMLRLDTMLTDFSRLSVDRVHKTQLSLIPRNLMLSSYPGGRTMGVY